MHVRKRYLLLILMLVIMIAASISQLYTLTIAEGAEEIVSSQVKLSEIVRIPEKGTRGTIMDASGIPLAYDQSSFNILIYKDPLKNASSDRAHYTDVLIKSIDIIERGGGKIIDALNIRRGDGGEFYYDFGAITDERAKQRRLENWLINMAICDKDTMTGEIKYGKNQDVSAEQIYYDLRSRYRIPENYGYEKARKLLSVWQEIQLSTYISYIPTVISYDVTYNIVAQIEMRLDELTGLQVERSSVRKYPKGDLAPHTIGYLGKMVDQETIDKMGALGYAPNDLLGSVGIESTMEGYLTGASLERQGVSYLEVNTSRKILREISSKPAQQGDNVVLTLDSQFQGVIQKALDDLVVNIREYQEKTYELNREKYDAELEKIGRDEINWVNSGAAIVMEVQTGRILAIASNPSFDPNIFTGGISQEDLDLLNNNKGSPLYDKTITAKLMPGSIFKMVTGVAGLMEGVITVKEKIDDSGEYLKYVKSGHGPACWTRYYSQHKGENIEKAIKDSCNYYFYTVADRLGIERLHSWADKFGLTSTTGIDLSYETAGIVGSQKTLYDSSLTIDRQKTWMPKLVFNQIRNTLRGYGDKRGVEYSDKQLDDATYGVLALVGVYASDELGEPIRRVLSDILDIPTQVSRGRGWSGEIAVMLGQLIWTGTDTVVTGIGTKITQVTPIGVARYISMLVNGGKRYKPYIVDRIIDSSGNVVTQNSPELELDIAIPEEFLIPIKNGMSSVVSPEDGGSAGDAFKGFKYSDQIGGKTGSAPVNKIDLETNGWFVAFAPFDKPEIAVVIAIPSGVAGARVAPAGRAILQYYFDKRTATTEKALPRFGTAVK